MNETMLRDTAQFQVRNQIGSVPGASVPQPFGGRYRLEGRIGDGEVVHLAAAPAEADSARLAGMGLQRMQCGLRCRQCLSLAKLGDQLHRLVAVGWRSAVARQIVGSESDESLNRQPPRHIADVRIESAVFVNDDLRCGAKSS